VQEEDGLGSVPVRVVFQAGQVEMTVADVERLAPGVLVPIDRTVDDAVDIVVNGKRIGRGGLVSVGNNLAIRVVRLNTDA
jgi:type III secretion protein Q